jgi:hypothetical protein
MGKRLGPKVTLGLSCNGCVHERSEHYAVQGYSGWDVHCDASEGRLIGDTTWDTPEWCPLRRVALCAFLQELEREGGGG